MKITIDARSLHDATKLLKPAIPWRATLPFASGRTVTIDAEQWERVLAEADAIKTFLHDNAA